MLLLFVFYARVIVSLPVPNNIQFLGRGYNIFKGDPHAKTVDPGFEAQVFDLSSYSQGRKTADQRMSVPDGAAIVNSEFCRKSFSATTISQSRSYDLALLSEVTIGGGPVGVAFSASPGFRKIHRDASRTELLIVETMSRCEVYTATMLRNQLPKYAQNFVAALTSLPETFDVNRPDAEQFWRFFRTFGTHVAIRISFGSRLSIRHEVMSEALDQFQQRAIGLQVAAEANAEAVYLKMTPKIERLKTDLQTYSRLIVSTEILAVGGLSNLNHLHEDWRDLTLANDLVPVQYELDSIVHYVGPQRQVAISAALHHFCHVYPNAICTTQTESTPQVCAGTQFTDSWAHSSCSLLDSKWVEVGCGSEQGLGALRLTRSARQRHRYMISTGCMALTENDNVADDDLGQYAAPMRRRARDDQQYSCAQGEFVTGLRLNRACFGDENLSLRCKRSARPFRRCRWSESTIGVGVIPSYSTIGCQDGEVVNSIMFASNPDSDLGKQSIRVLCCKFDDDCQPHEQGPFQESDMIGPTEPPPDQ